MPQHAINAVVRTAQSLGGSLVHGRRPLLLAAGPLAVRRLGHFLGRLRGVGIYPDLPMQATHLNTRYFEFPSDVAVRVREGWDFRDLTRIGIFDVAGPSVRAMASIEF